MKKILLTTAIFMFSSMIANSAEKQKCTELKLGKEYLKCLSGKIGGVGSSTEADTGEKKGWYQKIKDGKPLFGSKN
jgi:hypothetical protein